MKILGATLHNLVARNLGICFQTWGTLAQQHTITSQKTGIFCNIAVRTLDSAPLIVQTM
jgi:hypothetical protein